MTNSRARAIILCKVKASDQTKNSDDTLAADTELVLAVKANKRYTFFGNFIIKSHATPDWKYKLTVPSGASGTYNLADITKVASASAPIESESNLGTDDSVQVAYFYGYIAIGSTAGNLSLTWAQNTSDANATIVKAGSSITLIESQ